MATHCSTLAWRMPRDRGACWAIVRGVVKSWTRLETKHTAQWGHQSQWVRNLAHLEVKEGFLEEDPKDKGEMGG